MKKIYFLLFFLLACMNAFAAEPIPYKCITMTTSEWKGFVTDGTTPGWTTLSNTSNRPENCESTGFVRVWRANEVSAFDAWISSPELDLTPGKTYNVRFYYVTWGDKATYADLFEGRLTPAQINSAATAADYTSVEPFFSIDKISGTSSTTWHSFESTVTAGEGDRHVAFRFSGRYCKCIGITDFYIEEADDPSAPGAPQAATGVHAAADADGAVSANVSWTLPTHDIKGNPLTAIDKVDVIRDEKVAATLDGTAVTWTDTEATGLTKGEHTYTVMITANGLKSDLSETVAVTVGPWSYVPSDFGSWSSFSTTGKNWTSFSSHPAGSGQSGSMRIWTNTAVDDIDSWLTSPSLDLKAGKTYKLKLKYLVFYDNAAVIEHFRGHLATALPDDAGCGEIAASPAFLELDNITKGENSGDWKELSFLITPSEGQRYVTFHVFGEYCKHIAISDFSIESYIEKPFHPAAPTGLKATPGANHALTVALEWINPERDTEGDLFTPDKTIDNILVYRDGELAATLPGYATTWTDTETDGLTAGSHTYAVSAVVAGVESALSDEAEVAGVGPLQPYDPASWSSGFDSDMTEFENLWSTYNGSNNSTWIFNAQQGNIRLMNPNGYNEDAWLMTPPFSFIPGQYYTLKIEGYATAPDHPLTLALIDNPAAPSVCQYVINQLKAGDDHTFSFDISRSEHTFEFFFSLSQPRSATHAPAAGAKPYHIAIHANNTGIGANTFIYSVSLAEIPGKTTGVENVAAGMSVPVAVEVYDLSGRILGNASSRQLDGFPRGVYVIRAINADGSATTQKVIKAL